MSNHPSDTPDECCPVCFGEGSIDVDDLPKLRAATQALADVRTLDAWAHERHECRAAFRTDRVDGSFLCHSPSVTTKAWGRGPTPDAARAKAAAWVREQPVR